MCDIVVKKFTFAISSPDEFLYVIMNVVDMDVQNQRRDVCFVEFAR